MQVEALDTYKKYNIKDSELRRIPKVGERFTVSDKRARVLLGQNDYNLVFVKVVETKKGKEKKEQHETR